ncbi:hypothetical protein C8Q78DRAFT_442098 [Trametes maxima]|nr:hypothetical protein C8Q78DRAFT_442098 [Trametes maxima]
MSLKVTTCRTTQTSVTRCLYHWNGLVVLILLHCHGICSQICSVQPTDATRKNQATDADSLFPLPSSRNYPSGRISASVNARLGLPARPGAYLYAPPRSCARHLRHLLAQTGVADVRVLTSLHMAPTDIRPDTKIVQS